MLARPLIVALVLAASCPRALAGDPPGAEQLYAKAQAAMNDKRYAEAAELFHAAFALDPAPELLWAEARARHSAGELARARDLYKEFIQRDDAPAELRGKANDAIVEITLELEKPPDGAPETHDDTFGTVMVVTGGVLVAGGVVSHLVSFDAADDMQTFSVPSDTLDDTTRRHNYQDARSKRNLTQALAIIGYAAGGAAVVTGIVALILTDDPEPTTSRGVHVEPWLGAGVTGLSARLQF